MTTYTAADGNTYKTVTASSVSRAIANLDRGYMRRVDGMPYGFSVDTLEGYVRATNISNGDYSSEFCQDIYNAGFDFAIEQDSINYEGNYVVSLHIQARRV